ncbi:MAG: hypothetical protein WHT08_13770 [Bryobacteraceae bacterium]|jgi:hypothetical protein
MTLLEEAVARYHKILEELAKAGDPWVQQLREALKRRRLEGNASGVAPVLRPHFITRRQYENLVAASEALSSAIQRIRDLALADPQVMSRLALLPGERMLVSLDPGYSTPVVASTLEAVVSNGHLHLSAPRADLPRGPVASELLSGEFYESAPMKQFRKRYKVSRAPGAKPLVAGLLRAWKEFGGKGKPSVAILDFPAASGAGELLEHGLLEEFLRSQGLEAWAVSPDELEYGGGMLTAGGRRIDVILRGVKAQDFLTRYDLTHPLMRACRERRVCLVNSFRAEVLRKRALFALLTDESITASFPAAERKAIRETIPATRLVAPGKTTWRGETVDLLDFILKNRERLVLRPNEDSSELHSTDGALVDDSTWERALRMALRYPYVVQERVEAPVVAFPVDYFGELTYREMTVDVTPHAFLGKVHGFSARLSAPRGGFSSVAGLAPSFILEAR